MYYSKKIGACLLALMMTVPANAIGVLAEETAEEPVLEEEIAEIAEETKEEVPEIIEEAIEEEAEVIEEVPAESDEVIAEPAADEEPEPEEPEPEEPEAPVITGIVANTMVGDSNRAAVSFEVTVSDAAKLAGLTAEDFDVLNNGTNDLTTPEGEAGVRYEDDGIELTVDGNVLKMAVKPFRYIGIYEANGSTTPWEVVCSKDPDLSFGLADVTELKTQTLDDAVRGEYTYAGLTRQYALYIPKNEDGTDKTNVPLVIWNHGGGEYNINIEDTLIANRGLTAWNEEGYECAVLMIQVANANYSYNTAGNETKKKLIDQNNALTAAIARDLIADGTVNPQKVYVAGCSSGGGATMRFLMQYPEMFAGAIAMCSMDPIVEVHRNRTDTHEQIVAKFEEAWEGKVYTWDEAAGAMVQKDVNTQALLDVPIAYTHAVNDGTCRQESSLAMFESMANMGDTNNIERYYTNDDMMAAGISPSFYGGGLLHWSWVPVLNNTEEPEPMWWLFQQEAPEHIADVNFDLKAHVFDYGESIDKIVLDFTGAGVDLNNLKPEMFEIKATAVNPAPPSEQYAVAYEKVARTIDSITVDGEKAILNLHCEYGGAGEGTLQYAGGRNVNLDITYSVRFIDEIPMADGSAADRRSFTFVQNGPFSDDEVDAFISGMMNDTPYRLFIPENANDGTKHPLIVWLHGAGESGNNNSSQIRANRGALGFVTDEAQEIFNGAFVLAPQAHASWSAAEAQNVMDIITLLENKYNIDTARISVSGCSMGGGGTVRMATTYPDVWAAVVPICAAAGSVNRQTGEVTLRYPVEETMKYENVFFIHALNDPTVNPKITQKMAELCPNAETAYYDTVNVDGVEYPGHWSWIYLGINDAKAADGRSVWQWMADQRQPEAAETGVVVTPNPEESNSKYLATFTYVTDEPVEKITVVGGFQFFTEEEGKRYLAGDAEGIVVKDAFEAAEAEDIMYPYGYDPINMVQLEYELEQVGINTYQVTLPLPSDQWFYHFNITDNGETVTVEDPSNPYVVHPFSGNNSGWCIFYTGTPDEALAEMGLTFPRTDGQTGTYEYVTYTGATGNEEPLVVYLPYGYDASKEYPVLYISHGGGGTEMDWATVGAVSNIFDNAIAEGEVEPTVVAIMNNTVFGWNMSTIKDNMLNALIPYMEENYSASPEPADRAFAGLSMGGLTATSLYQNAAAEFGYFGIWSATNVFEVKDVPDFDVPVVMLGAGYMDFGNGAYPGLIEKAAEAGLDWSDDMYYVNDAHNWFCWPDLLAIMTTDYLWEGNAEYEAGVVYEENTDFPNTDAKWQATFTYLDDEAEEVVLTGAFQYWTKGDMAKYKAGDTDITVKTPFEYKKGMVQTGYNPVGDMVQIPLHKVKTGVWQAVVPLASGEYYYDYVVDGVTMQDPANRSVANPANGRDSGHSLIWIGEYGETDMLEGQEYVLPRNDKNGQYEFVEYTTDKGVTSYVTVYTPFEYDESKEYKTLYISHGAGGNEVEWHFIGATDNIFDNLIAEGLVEETIVVSMSFYDCQDFTKNLLENIIPVIEEKYSVSKNPEDRAMAGLSAGSSRSQQVYRNAAGEFGYFGFWSAASNFDVNAVENKNFPVLMLGAGPFDFAYSGYAGLKSRLEAAGVDYKWYEFNGAHDWGVWRAAVTAFAKDILWKGDSSKAMADQVIRITGDDWGAGVDKSIIHFDTAIDPDSVSKGDFTVMQSMSGGAASARTILKAYTSDAEGNEVAEASEYVTIDMRISPVEGNPIIWSMQTWTNSWADPYVLDVAIRSGENIKTAEGDAITKLIVNTSFDVKNIEAEDVLIPQLEGYEYDTFEASDGMVIPYGLYTPAEDDKQNALIIWNHGVGERGFDPRIALLGNEVTALNGEEFQALFEGAYVLVPQTPSSGQGDIVEGKTELIEKLLKENPDIDPDRVIVGGCSMGGGQTMNMVYTHADLYAAAYPVCPASTSSQVSDEYINNIANLPIWFIHCVNDDTVNYANTSEALIERLKAAGNKNVHMSTFEDVHDTTGRFNDLTEDGSDYQYATHWSWVYFDNNECFCDECEDLNCWEWLAQQRRGGNFLFDDVQDPDKYYYDPVYWAYFHKPQITKGTSETLFSPDADVSRAQIVTFLYRAAGEPEVSGDMPFTDVTEDRYFYNAVLWAKNNNITTGTSPDKFTPDGKCTRAQIVTFLWRYLKEPKPEKAAEFEDLREGAYYLDAVAWAAETGVTTGTSPTQFSPDKTCTRGQAVTFIYRAIEGN